MQYLSQAKIFFTLFLLIHIPVSVYASDILPTEKPPIFNSFCTKAKTPADKQACTQKRYEHAEDKLKKQFDAFLRFLTNTNHAEEMKTSQNAWIEYRNKECAFEAGFFEEEIAKRTLELSCLSRLTEQRTLVLYNFVPRVRTQTQNKVIHND